MLIGNYSVLLKTPGRFMSGSTVSDNRANFNQSGRSRGLFLTTGNLAAIPNGYRPDYSWMIPQQSGGMASNTLVTGNGATNGSLAGGLNAEAFLTGEGDITEASIALIVSAVAEILGQGALTAEATATIQASASLEGAGSVTSALNALASVVGAIMGEGTVTASMRADASMGAAINVTGDLLSTSNVAASIWGAIASSFNEDGTMGELLHNSGAAGTPPTVGEIATAVLAAITDTGYSVDQLLSELARLQGNVAGEPLVVTPTTRTAGGVTQTISESNGTVTVTRT